MIAALAAAGCSGAATPQANDKLKVVATYSILGDFVGNVGGDAVALTTLVGPGGDAHTHELTPSDVSAVADADLVFANGLQFEPWLDDLYAASGSAARRVTVTDGIQPRQAEADERGEPDPHTWHDVSNAMRMVDNIRDALAAADPAQAALYRARAEAYLAQLRELDQWVREQVDGLPAERRRLVTSHDTFGYFADRYGFTVIGSALGTSTESADPSAASIAQLVDAIKATGVPAIFAENVANPQLMEQIAAEAGVVLAPPLFTDALGPPGSPGDTYLNMIRYNVATIVDALSH